MADLISLKNPIMGHFKMLNRNYSSTVQAAKVLALNVKNKQVGHYDF